jgi:plastocyanin
MEQPDQISTGSNRKRKFTVVLAGFAALIVAVVGITVLTSTDSDKKTADTVNKPAAPIAEIRITDSGFVPATLSVKPGTKIIWTNTGQAMHQVVSNPYPKGSGLSSLKSGILNDAQTYSYVANAIGSFGYHDQLNPTINGTLVVEKQ